MDIKCINNPNYFLTPSREKTIHFQGTRNVSKVVERLSAGVNAGLCEDILVRRPIANKSAIGLLGFVAKCKTNILNYLKNYKKNIQHTYEHKVVFALIERELFGKNSIDSITHDLDKLILYILGCPKSIVSKIHRNISVHHATSGKKMNLRSMLCDNIASSPEFKPEKKKSLREHYNTSAELQGVKGLKEIFEKYNYGENLDFKAIKSEKDLKFKAYNKAVAVALNLFAIFYTNAKSTHL